MDFEVAKRAQRSRVGMLVRISYIISCGNDGEPMFSDVLIRLVNEEYRA